MSNYPNSTDVRYCDTVVMDTVSDQSLAFCANVQNEMVESVELFKSYSESDVSCKGNALADVISYLKYASVVLLYYDEDEGNLRA